MGRLPVSQVLCSGARSDIERCGLPQVYSVCHFLGGSGRDSLGAADSFMARPFSCPLPRFPPRGQQWTLRRSKVIHLASVSLAMVLENNTYMYTYIYVYIYTYIYIYILYIGYIYTNIYLYNLRVLEAPKLVSQTQFHDAGARPKNS